MNAVKRDPVEVGAYVLSPEAYRLSSFILFGALILICVILTVAFTDIPENTELVRAFGYNNVCVYSTSPRNGNPVNGSIVLASWSSRTASARVRTGLAAAANSNRL